MKAYSKDVREYVLRAVDQGHSRAEIVKMFGVSLVSIKRYLKQGREIGDLSPKPFRDVHPRNMRPWKLAWSHNCKRTQIARCKLTASCGKARMACGWITRR